MSGRAMSAHGLSVVVPVGWDGSIRRSRGDGDDTPWEDVGPLGTSNPVLHVASFPLPRVRGDYGGGAVETMRPTDVFVALVEFDHQASRTPLFASLGPDRFGPDDFDRATMHRPMPGHSGHQQFFHTRNGRAFSLYVALGSHRLRSAGAARAAAVVSTIRID